ncbi:MAG: cbb3-type cytochrome c oxidase subunit 3 [Verrucomicrobiota bacterium]
MIKNVVEHLEQVDTIGVFSILLFFGCFIGMLVWVFRLKKSYVNSMKVLPLDDSLVEHAQTSNPDDTRHE